MRFHRNRRGTKPEARTPVRPKGYGETAPSSLSSTPPNERALSRPCLLGACRELAPSKQESTTYEPSLVCKLLILGCRLLIPDRLLGSSNSTTSNPEALNAFQ